MQRESIALLLVSGASLYIVRKLFAFIKALQAIQYVKAFYYQHNFP